MMVEASFQMPPWSVFPLVKLGDRELPTGFLEYGEAWTSYFFGLTPDGQAAYEEQNPEPNGWQGFYESIKGPQARARP